MKTYASPELLKKELAESGQTIAAYAEKKGVAYPMAVAILNGYKKGVRGKSFEAARKLGIKVAA